MLKYNVGSVAINNDTHRICTATAPDEPVTSTTCTHDVNNANFDNNVEIIDVFDTVDTNTVQVED
jgi:hypothetical protein